MTMRAFASAHLGEALQWRRTAPIGRRAVAVAALGMIVPVLVGLAVGQPGVGFTIGLGAMLLAGGGGEATADETPRSPGAAVLPALLAVVAATAIAGQRWTDVAMLVLATLAATVSGYSRPVGVGAIRFIVYFVLSLSLLANAGEHRGGAALLFGLGALWNVAVRTMLVGRATVEEAAPAQIPARPTPTSAQRRAHWRRTMREAYGWQYPIRLAAGLAAASVMRAVSPAHHYGWIVATVALLTQRPLEHVPVKITQRAIGTIVGVGLTWAVLAAGPPTILLAALICLLAAAAPIARARSYLAYSSVATPAILLVIDIGKPIASGLLVDRLVATLAGAAIVVAANLAANLAADRWIAKPAPKPSRRARPDVAKPGDAVAPASTEAAPPR